MGGTCGTQGNLEMDTGFWWGKLEERNHAEDVGAVRNIILKGS
jgi:hypothetical protein